MKLIVPLILLLAGCTFNPDIYCQNEVTIEGKYGQAVGYACLDDVEIRRMKNE